MGLFGHRKSGLRVPVNAAGWQEAEVVVKGAYAPDSLVVKAGAPVRLNFRREDSAGCSERVVFADFGIDVLLPQGETVPVDLRPEQPGTYSFTCGMGMLRGHLRVEA